MNQQLTHSPGIGFMSQYKSLYMPPPRNVNTKMHFFCGIVQIFDINIIFNEIWVSSEQESPKNRAGGLVAGHPSFICSELHHPSGLYCKEGFEDNPKKLEEGGVSPHANAGRHVPPVRHVSARMRMRDLSGSSGWRGVGFLKR